jgi:hypothetical protein
MKSYAQYISEIMHPGRSLVEESDYEQGVSHNVTVHRGNQDHAVGKHLNKHHPEEDHAGYIHIHTSKDGRHKYHAQVHSGLHDDGINTHAHYIHHDTRTGKVQDIPSRNKWSDHPDAENPQYESHKSPKDFAKHVEKHTGHKMDPESAEKVHHHHEVMAHEHSVITQPDHPEKLPKHIAHKGYNTPGFKDGHLPKPSHYNVRYHDTGLGKERFAKHQEDGI